MTTIYLMRHSEVLKPNNINNSNSLQLQNEKWVLTVNGEKLAKKKSKLRELKNLDCVYCSNYTRAICTAKYFSKDKINIIEDFGERKFGIKTWDEMPTDFEKKQFEDHDYKFGDGESVNEVISRQEKALLKVLDNHKGQRVLIVGHATALAYLFSKWCDISFTGPYKYNGNEFFDGKWDYCEAFKLEFDNDNNLVSIKNI